MIRQYQVYLHGTPFGVFEAESPINAITRARLSSPLFRSEPYKHFTAGVVSNGVSSHITKVEDAMRTYTVTISADAIVSGTVEIEAISPQEARAKVLAMKEEDIAWEVGTLHESIENCGTVVYLDGKEVGEPEGF